MYTPIYMYTYIHTYVYIYIHAYIHTYIDIQKNPEICLVQTLGLKSCIPMYV